MKEETRRLSTILFADIAGYTSLMQSDEPKAMQFLSSFKTELNKTVPSFGGQIVQYFGDACLLSFDSTSDSVQCAMKLQLAFLKEDIPIRIGMHLGEVIFRENNAFGDGVNIASRIESMGVPGAILVSKSVRDQIKNKSEFELSSLGAFEFKNVEEPLQVFAVSNPGFTVPDRQDLKGKFKETPEKKRGKRLVPIALVAGIIALLVLLYNFVPGLKDGANTTEITRQEARMAVMPFQNLSPDDSDLHYCNGVMQNVVDNLSRIPEFIVLPSRTTNRYKESALLPTEIGDELGVDYLIDGTFQKIDSLIQVTVALISTEDGRQIWTNEKATFLFSDLFSMQAQIANEVASQLKTTLSLQLNSAFENIPTKDEMAYEYYLRGNEILRDFDEELRSKEDNIQTLSDAKIYFNLAVERDSTFASPYLGLAKIEFEEKYWANLLKDSTLVDYNKLVDKALQLDPELTEGYLMKGIYADRELKAFAEAEKYYLKALDINPNNIDALYALSDLYDDAKFDLVESIRLLKEIEYRTVDEEELYRIYERLSGAYSKIMDRDMQHFYLEKCIEINDSLTDLQVPGFYLVHGQPEKALAELKKRFPNPDTQFQLLVYGAFYSQIGQFEEAVKYYEQWANLVDIQGVTHWMSQNDRHRYGQALVKTGQDSLGVSLMRKQLSINRQLFERGFVLGGYDIAGIYAFLHMPDSAFYYLMDADALVRSGMGNFILMDHQFDNIRSEKRFIERIEEAKAKMREIRKQLPSVDPNAPVVN